MANSLHFSTGICKTKDAVVHPSRAKKAHCALWRSMVHGAWKLGTPQSFISWDIVQKTNLVKLAFKVTEEPSP